MVRTAAADELCEYCRVSLEFFSNTARYLHYLRHYRDKRQEAGYHLLDRSRLEDRDLTVSNMRELEETLSTYRVREWCDISNFPSSDTATFPRVRPCSQVMTSGLQQPLTIRKVEHS